VGFGLTEWGSNPQSITHEVSTLYTTDVGSLWMTIITEIQFLNHIGGVLCAHLVCDRLWVRAPLSQTKDYPHQWCHYTPPMWVVFGLTEWGSNPQSITHEVSTLYTTDVGSLWFD
jgi:hypothetical protein